MTYDRNSFNAQRVAAERREFDQPHVRAYYATMAQQEDRGEAIANFQSGWYAAVHTLAVPRLLEALERLLVGIDSAIEQADVDEAREAVRQARGEQP